MSISRPGIRATVAAVVVAIAGSLGLALSAGAAAAADVDEGRIRLEAAPPEGDDSPPHSGSGIASAERGFDYGAFESRLQSLWFERKVLLSQGVTSEAPRLGEAIRGFCESEGIERVPGLAGALILESGRALDRGEHARAIAALELADDLDPGRSQIAFARSQVLWSAGRGVVPAATAWTAGLKDAAIEAISDFGRWNVVAIIAILASMLTVGAFSLLMVARHQSALRHEIEEWAIRCDRAWLAKPAGWLVLLLPLVTWIGAGWAALYWLALLFRFMRRSERIATVALLVAVFAAVPAFRVGVAMYGLTNDPSVRIALEASSGAYSPDRVVRLRRLVSAYPDDPTYRFLLAGLYKRGRYYREAFDEYRHALRLEPSLYQAYVNIGNIYHSTGQYDEAIANYLKATRLRPDATLAHYNMHLSQAEAFRFKESKESLMHARDLDGQLVSDWMSEARPSGARASVLDARIDLGSIWQAAFEGGAVKQRLTARHNAASLSSLPSEIANPVSVLASLALLAALVNGFVARARETARGCIRCGRAFCGSCRSGKEGREYCSQCLHLFVIGDGLAPETKTRKLYEVERHESRRRVGRRLAGLVFPGAAQVLRGRMAAGVGLMFVWVLAVICWRPNAGTALAPVFGFEVRLDFLHMGAVPSAFHVDPVGVVALAIAVATWILANVGGFRRREA